MPVFMACLFSMGACLHPDFTLNPNPVVKLSAIHTSTTHNSFILHHKERGERSGREGNKDYKERGRRYRGSKVEGSQLNAATVNTQMRNRRFICPSQAGLAPLL